ncbi:PREDICTED: anaphase-promoting complex subunit 4-like [Priapulus caudatus]|uniref:Anaphase-promoting complex subunit 4-like n=1 Tax=Priapulus caudatus TaxID=37621 RepID=A0ABM1EHW5_PRICU|nr:PREDICTED: anaphase-promoting complex subunit 4-like [Priapulus caudatus]
MHFAARTCRFKDLSTRLRFLCCRERIGSILYLLFYVAVILRLSDETPMAEINKVTQQDLAFVAEFLKESFTEEQSVPPQVKTEVSSDQAKPSFHLERVGQYLKDEPLHFPPDTSTNPWEQVLSENANLRDHKSHFPHDTKKSLIQQYSELKRILDDVFDQPAFVIGKTFSVSASRLLFRSTDANSNLLGRVTQLNSAGSSLLTTFMLKQSSCATKALHMLKQTTGDPSSLSVMVVHFGPIRSQDDSVTSPAPAMASELHVVKDVRYYDEDTMSVLLHQETADAVPILAQVPLCELKSWSSVGGAADLTQCLQTLVPVDGSHLLNPTNCRCLENMKAAALAVSGTRKVACVLFMSRKRVRLFEMDVEDEEEDEEEEESLDMADESKIDISGTKSPSDDDKENVS